MAQLVYFAVYRSHLITTIYELPQNSKLEEAVCSIQYLERHRAIDRSNVASPPTPLINQSVHHQLHDTAADECTPLIGYLYSIVYLFTRFCECFCYGFKKEGRKAITMDGIS